MSKDDKKSEAKPEVEAKPEAAPSNAIADAVKAAIIEALPLATAMAAQASRPAPQAVSSKPGPVSSERCTDCRQLRAACKGEHRMAIVWPADDEAAEWFTGVKLNGVRYISNGPGHSITVPKDCNVEYIVQAWNANEVVTRRGRRVKHNSGSIGQGSNNYNAFNGSGFGER